MSESEPEIPSELGVEQAAATVAGYAKLAFAFFARGFIHVPFHKCMYKKGRGGPGGGAIAGSWQDREIEGSGS